MDQRVRLKIEGLGLIDIWCWCKIHRLVCVFLPCFLNGLFFSHATLWELLRFDFLEELHNILLWKLQSVFCSTQLKKKKAGRPAGPGAFGWLPAKSCSYSKSSSFKPTLQSEWEDPRQAPSTLFLALVCLLCLHVCLGFEFLLLSLSLFLSLL